MKTACFIGIIFLVVLLFCFFIFITVIWREICVYDNIMINDECYTVLDKPKTFYFKISSVNEIKTIFVGELLLTHFYIV